jgi:hypothetical protein
VKKLLLSLTFATALAAPALADDINVSVTATQDLTQIGVNNGAAQIQNIAGEDLEVDDDAFKNIETALDLGDLEIQNVEYIIGDHSEIAGVQNINDDVENASVLNADDVADVKIDVSFSENTDNSNTDNTVDNSTNDNSIDNSNTDNSTNGLLPPV